MATPDWLGKTADWVEDVYTGARKFVAFAGPKSGAAISRGASALGASPGWAQDIGEASVAAGTIAAELVPVSHVTKPFKVLGAIAAVGKAGKAGTTVAKASASALKQVAAKDAKTPYNARAWRDHLEQKYPGQVSSTTVPPRNAKNVKLSGKGHPETGVPFDTRGYPIFDEHIAYQTRIPGAKFSTLSYEGQMRAATKDLAKQLEQYPALKAKFSPDAVKAIQSGKAQIPEYTVNNK